MSSDKTEAQYREHFDNEIGLVAAEALVQPTVDLLKGMKDPHTLDPEGKLETASEVWDYLATDSKFLHFSSRTWAIYRELFERVLNYDTETVHLFGPKLKSADKAWLEHTKKLTRTDHELPTIAPSAAAFTSWTMRIGKLSTKLAGRFFK